MFLFLGMLFLIIGISDFKEHRKYYAYIYFLVSCFVIFVAVYTFIT
ncbi:YczI family protein [Bacillus cereus]|nr:YczI family protein [Bacillus cereus]